jgi:hypothetical protein
VKPIMRDLMAFSIACPTLGRKVELETRNWEIEIDGENEFIHYRAQCVCGTEHFGFAPKARMLPSEIRAYVTGSFSAMWQYPVGEQLFSTLAGDRDYVCMTAQAINFWRGGKLSACAHDAETRARYDLLRDIKTNEWQQNSRG